MFLRVSSLRVIVKPASARLFGNYRSPSRRGDPVDRFALIRRIVEWARGEYFGTPAAGPARHFTRLLDKIQVTIKAQGARGAIAWIKRRRSDYLNYLAHRPDTKEGRKYRNKIISHFGRSQARVLLKRRAPVIRMVLTALTSLRSLSLPVRVDLSTVTDPFSGTSTFRLTQYIPGFWSVLKRGGKVPVASSVH
jgi:hypothetical protein